MSSEKYTLYKLILTHLPTNDTYEYENIQIHGKLFVENVHDYMGVSNTSLETKDGEVIFISSHIMKNSIVEFIPMDNIYNEQKGNYLKDLDN